MQKEETIVIGMGEIEVSRNTSAVLACIGLGSCIAVCAYDPVSRVGGMVHIVLPDSGGKMEDALGKYANTAIPLLLQRLADQGGARSRLIVKYTGGAQMALTLGVTAVFDTGARNLVSVKAALAQEKIFPVASATGGNKGRTVRLYLDTGKVMVKTVGDEPWEL